MWLACRFTPNCRKSGRASSERVDSSSPCRNFAASPSVSYAPITCISACALARTDERSWFAILNLLSTEPCQADFRSSTPHRSLDMHVRTANDALHLGRILPDEVGEFGRRAADTFEAVLVH